MDLVAEGNNTHPPASPTCPIPTMSYPRLVKHIPSSLDGVLRLKIRTVEQCAVQLLQRLERSLASAWFEAAQHGS